MNKHTLTRHSGLLALTLAAMLGVSGTARADNPSPSATPGQEAAAFKVGEGSAVFDSASARGRVLVVHVLSGRVSQANAAYLKDLAKAASTVAGVTHVIVQNASEADFRATVATAPESLVHSMYRDSSGAAEQLLHLEGTIDADGASVAAPAVLVLDPAGKELYRRIGKKDTDRDSATALAKKIGELTRDRRANESSLDGGLALGGYDPVAYLDEQKAAEGSARIQSAYCGVTYRFTNLEHREKFNADPEHYLPAYGGWCATAMAYGRKVEVDPKNFKVTQGRLFLFYKGLRGNALNDWNKDEAGQTRKADEHWQQTVEAKK